ncbi:hypothetical protein FRB95_006414 [Tulasnella sp. JGI-2019a]|nr:hypothetical protein FRB95_006414 [Tulasnella sp. JGI-2019a]
MDSGRMDVDKDTIEGGGGPSGSTSVTAQNTQEPLPEYAKSWNLPGLRRAPVPPPETLEQRIHPDSLFYIPYEEGALTGRFVVPMQCHYCLTQRKRFCDRAYPVCTACAQFDVTCVPSRTGYMELPARQGPGSRSGRGGMGSAAGKRPAAARSSLGLSQPQKRPAKVKAPKTTLDKTTRHVAAPEIGSWDSRISTPQSTSNLPDLTVGVSDSLPSGLSDISSEVPLVSPSGVSGMPVIISKKDKVAKWDVTRRSWMKPPVARKSLVVASQPSKPDPDRFEVWGETLYELRQAMPILDKLEHGFQISSSGLLEVLLLDGGGLPKDSWTEDVLTITLSMNFKLSNFNPRGSNSQSVPPLPPNPQFDSMMLSYSLGLPFCLIAGKGYDALPFPLRVPYGVIGWFNIIEAQRVQKTTMGTGITETTGVTATISVTFKVAPTTVSKTKFAATPQGKKRSVSLAPGDNGDEDDSMDISDEDIGGPARKAPALSSQNSSIDGSPILQLSEIITDAAKTPPQAPTLSVYNRWVQVDNFAELRPPTKQNFASSKAVARSALQGTCGSLTSVAYKPAVSLGPAAAGMFLKPEKRRPIVNTGSSNTNGAAQSNARNPVAEIQGALSEAATPTPQAPVLMEPISSRPSQLNEPSNLEVEQPIPQESGVKELPEDDNEDASALSDNFHPMRLCGPEELNFPPFFPKELSQVTQVQAVELMFRGFVCRKCKKANVRDCWATLRCTHCKTERPACQPNWNLAALIQNPWSPGERDDTDQSKELVVRQDTWSDSVKVMAYSSDAGGCKFRMDHVISTAAQRIHELDGVLAASKDIVGLTRPWVYHKGSSKSSSPEPELANFFLQVAGEGGIADYGETKAISFNQVEDAKDKATMTITEYSAQCASRTHLAKDAEPWGQQVLSMGNATSPMYEDILDKDVCSETTGEANA